MATTQDPDVLLVATATHEFTGASSGLFEIETTPQIFPSSALFFGPLFSVRTDQLGLFTFPINGIPSGKIFIKITAFEMGKIRGEITQNDLGSASATMSIVIYGYAEGELKEKFFRVRTASKSLPFPAEGEPPLRVFDLFFSGFQNDYDEADKLLTIIQNASLSIKTKESELPAVLVGKYPEQIENIVFDLDTLNVDFDSLTKTLSVGAKATGGGGAIVGIATITSPGAPPKAEMVGDIGSKIPVGTLLTIRIPTAPEPVVFEYVKTGEPSPGHTPIPITDGMTDLQVLEVTHTTIGNRIDTGLLSMTLDSAVKKLFLKSGVGGFQPDFGYIPPVSHSTISMVVSDQGSIAANTYMADVASFDAQSYSGVVLINKANVPTRNMAIGDSVVAFMKNGDEFTWHCAQFSTWE